MHVANTTETYFDLSLGISNTEKFLITLDRKEMLSLRSMIFTLGTIAGVSPETKNECNNIVNVISRSLDIRRNMLGEE